MARNLDLAVLAEAMCNYKYDLVYDLVIKHRSILPKDICAKFGNNIQIDQLA